MVSAPDLNYFTCTLGEAAELHSKTQPPYSTINAFLDTQAEEVPNLPAIALPSLGGGGGGESGCEVVSFRNMRDYSLKIAHHLISQMPQDPESQNHDAVCVALLCYTSFDFILMWLGLIRAGYQVLLLSPKCNPVEIAHLCKSCKTLVLFHDVSSQATARNLVSAKANIQVQLIPWLEVGSSRQSLLQQTPPSGTLLTRNIKASDTAYLHHTSGTSSGSPKPIPQPHHAAVGALPRLDGHDSATFTTTPLYHGGIADCFRAWTSSAMIVLFPEDSVPISAKNIISCLEAVANTELGLPKVRYFSSVPYVLQIMAQDKTGMEWLKKMDLVGVGGAALPQLVGDSLVQQNVNLVSRFGSAECGFLLSSHRNYATEKAWQYLRPPANSKYLQFEKNGSSTLFELVVLSGWPHMAKRNRVDGSWTTSDLFEAHPSIPHAWRYHSRSDAQITLLTGKKFDPAPIEEEICGLSTLIEEMVIFGTGRQVPGALIFPSQIAACNDPDRLRGMIWVDIEVVNSKTPAHARLTKDMLVFMHPTRAAVPRSSKGTILRKAAEEKYKSWIDGAYDDKSQKYDSDLEISDKEILSRVRDIIQDVMGSEHQLDCNADLFHQGVDSAKCAQIRGQLQKLIKNPLPSNVVYDQENVEQLGNYLLQARRGSIDVVEKDEKQMMSQLVEKYSRVGDNLLLTKYNELPNGNQELDSGHYVLLTGATGTLGANILALLQDHPNIERVFCLVRAKSDEEAYLRVSTSLFSRKKRALSSGDQRVICLASDLARPDLNLSSDVLSKVIRNTSIVIHTAWAVNFALPLSSFVQDHITGLHNLLNLIHSQSKPAKFLFCSSTASVLHSNHSHSPHSLKVPECISNDPNTASPLGYARSKWVAESICAAVNQTEKLNGRVNVLRIGQLTGDSEHGVWNMKEAWPLMLSTSLPEVLGCLPALRERVSWLPVDVAAKAIVGIACSSVMQQIPMHPAGVERDAASECPVYHVVSTEKHITWMDILTWLQRARGPGKSFDIVSPNEWISRLEQLEVKHPAKHLLGLWKKAYSVDGTATNGFTDLQESLEFEIRNTRDVCGTDWNARGVDEMFIASVWMWMVKEIARV
ncbi:hypothetical protein BP6252_06347 [Coleophoma cylindrospora]|uniref:Carrier domain-containing protein n=1 Tax=Coleophoma cylindrospora TaxID=1849047 RepID=A0A3D8RMB7_9HELO|nr:hypothetical protein BP6252_06347 [Coleophoma cylindrospora]